MSIAPAQTTFTPARMPSRTPALAWPSVDQVRQQVELEIGPHLRSKGASDAEVAQAVVREAANRQKSDGKLREAHRDLEAFFVGMLLTEMKKSVKKTSGLTDGGRGEEIFEKMLTEQQSKAIASRGEGLGIARMLDQAHLRKLHAAAHEPQDGPATLDWPAELMRPRGEVTGMHLPSPEAMLGDDLELSPVGTMRTAIARSEAGAAYAQTRRQGR